MGYNESIKEVAENLHIKSGKILITGATGLIGSCVIDVLLCANKNYNAQFVIYALGRSLERIRQRFKDGVIPVIQDICDPITDLDEFDFIIHAASNADPRNYAKYPAETVLTNIMGTKNILDYCKRHLNSRVLLTSTFEVYGTIENQDFYSESDAGTIDFHILRNGYPESKRCAEILLNSYIDEYNVDGVAARLASIYGPTMLKSDSKAHAQFIWNALENEDIVLKSKGLQRRTYCYVIDAVSALLVVLFSGEKGETYNISNEKSTATIAEVAKTVAEIAGTQVVFELPDEEESKGFSKPQNCILNNAKLRSLGWTGKYSLFDGLKETIDYLVSID